MKSILQIVVAILIVVVILVSVNYGLEKLDLYDAHHPGNDWCVPIKNKYC